MKDSSPNTFSKGMISDVDPNYQPKDSYRYAKNARVISNDGNSLAIELKEGNKLAFTLSDYSSVISLIRSESRPHKDELGFSITINSQLVEFSYSNLSDLEFYEQISLAVNSISGFSVTATYTVGGLYLYSESGDINIEGLDSSNSGTNATGDYFNIFDSSGGVVNTNSINTSELIYHDKIITSETSPTYKYVGHESFPDELILFTYAEGVVDSENRNLSQIWSVKTIGADGTSLASPPTILYNNYLDFNNTHKIISKGIDENEHYKRVYWTDNGGHQGKNGLRVFNVKDPDGFAIPLDAIDVFSSIDMSHPVARNVSSGGSLKGGYYQYCYQLISEAGAVSEVSPLSELVHIVNNSESINSTSPFIYNGEGINEMTDKQVTIQVRGIDESFKYINFIAIHYADEVSGVPTNIDLVSTVEIIGTDIVSFSHTGNEITSSFSLDEILIKKMAWKKCKDIDVKDNRLFAANLEDVGVDLKLDDKLVIRSYDNSGNTYSGTNNPNNDTYRYLPWTVDVDGSGDSYRVMGGASEDWYDGSGVEKENVDAIRYYFKVEEYLLTDKNGYCGDQAEYSPASGGASGIDYIMHGSKYPFREVSELNSTAFSVEDDVLHSSGGFIKGNCNPIESQTLRGYQREETYRFGVVFHDEVGRPTFVNWTADVKMPYQEDKYWECEYVSGIFKITNAVDNHQKRDFRVDRRDWVESKFNSPSSRSSHIYARPLYPVFEVKLSEETRSKIQSYSIVRVKRGEIDKTVIASGLINQNALFSNQGHLIDGDNIPASHPRINGIMAGQIGISPDPASYYRHSDSNSQMFKPSISGYTFDSPDILFDGVDYNYKSGDKLKITGIGKSQENNIAESNEWIGKYGFYGYGRMGTNGEINEDFHAPNATPTSPESSSYISPSLGISSKNFSLAVWNIPSSWFVGAARNSSFRGDNEIREEYDLDFAKVTGRMEGVQSSDVSQSEFTYNFINGSRTRRDDSPDQSNGDSQNWYKPYLFPQDINDDAGGDNGILYAHPHFSSSSNPQHERMIAHPNTGSKTLFMYLNASGASGEEKRGFDLKASWQHSHFGHDSSGVLDTSTVVSPPIYDDSDHRHYLCAFGYIKRPLTKQYGGDSNIEKSKNTYISCSHYQRLSDDISVDRVMEDGTKVYISRIGGGDTFITMHGGHKLSAGNILDLHSTEYRGKLSKGRMFSQMFPIESSINTDLREGKYWMRDNYDIGNTDSVTIDTDTEFFDEIADALGIGDSDDVTLTNEAATQPIWFEDYIYNKVWSKENDLFSYKPKPYNFKETHKSPYSIAYSNIKLIGEPTDAWLQFPAFEFYDMEGVYGGITNLLNWRDNIYVIQEEGLAKLAVNSRALIPSQDGSGISIQTGAGNVIERDDYISTQYGSKHQHSLHVADNGFSWVDMINKMIFKFNGQLSPISDMKGLRGLMKNQYEDSEILDMPLSLNGIHSGYEYKYNECLFSFLGGIGAVFYTVPAAGLWQGIPYTNSPSTFNLGRVETSGYTFDGTQLAFLGASWNEVTNTLYSDLDSATVPNPNGDRNMYHSLEFQVEANHVYSFTSQCAFNRRDLLDTTDVTTSGIMHLDVQLVDNSGTVLHSFNLGEIDAAAGITGLYGNFDLNGTYNATTTTTCRLVFASYEIDKCWRSFTVKTLRATKHSYQSDTAAYSDGIQAFTSFYNPTPIAYINHQGRVYTPRIDEQNKYYLENQGEELSFYDNASTEEFELEYVVNDGQQVRKTFDSSEVLTSHNGFTSEIKDRLEVYMDSDSGQSHSNTYAANPSMFKDREGNLVHPLRGEDESERLRGNWLKVKIKLRAATSVITNKLKVFGIISKFRKSFR